MEYVIAYSIIRLLFWYRVVSSLIPRMASDNSLDTKPRSIDYTIAPNCLIGVFTAGWGKPARFVSQKEKLKKPVIKGKVLLVKPYGSKRELFHGASMRACFKRDIAADSTSV